MTLTALTHFLTARCSFFAYTRMITRFFLSLLHSDQGYWYNLLEDDWSSLSLPLSFFFFFRKKYRTFETAWNIKLTLFCKYISILFKNFNLDLYSIVIKLNHTCLKEREPINRKDQIIANKLYLGYVFRNSGFGIFIKFSLTFSFLNHSKWRRALSFSTH